MAFLVSSIGKKALMAFTGFLLCAFLIIHLLGNIVVFFDNDGHLTFPPGGDNANLGFQWVAEHYSKVPLLFHVGEVLLLGLIALHAFLGVTLWWQNNRARGGGYVRQRSEGGRTIFSATMPWTGLCFILVFVIVHLQNFRFGDQDSPEELYELLGVVFDRWPYMLVYVVAMIGLGAHLSHGFQSAFQSLGLNHPRYTPWIQGLGYLFALVMLLGFASIPIAFFLNGGGA